MSTIATALGQITSEDAEREASERKARDETAAQYVALLLADEPDAGDLRRCMATLGLTADDVASDAETVARAKRASEVYDSRIEIEPRQAELSKRVRALKSPKVSPGPISAMAVIPRLTDEHRELRRQLELLDGEYRHALLAGGELTAMARARPLLFDLDKDPPRLKGQSKAKARPKKAKAAR